MENTTSQSQLTVRSPTASIYFFSTIQIRESAAPEKFLARAFAQVIKF
jgi:hypothetical protein